MKPAIARSGPTTADRLSIHPYNRIIDPTKPIIASDGVVAVTFRMRTLLSPAAWSKTEGCQHHALGGLWRAAHNPHQREKSDSDAYA